MKFHVSFNIHQQIRRNFGTYKNNTNNSGNDSYYDSDNKKDSNGDNNEVDNVQQDEPDILVNCKIKEYSGFC